MIEDLLDDAKRRMDKSVEATAHEFNTVRTGRASAALLDRIEVDYYGQETPLNQLATINVPEPRMLTIQPYDPSSIKSIERAIQESELGLTPSNDGKLIRLPIPQLTEERRKELVKVVRHLAEEGRVAVRNVRRDCMHHLKELVRDGDVGDDEERRAEDRRAEAHRRARGQDRRAPQAQGRGDHGGLRPPGARDSEAREPAHQTADAPGPQARRGSGSSRTSRVRSRSSWTATAAGPGGAACPSPPGHRAGTRALRRTVEAAIDLGVESLCVYAFSTENWSRPPDEVDALMEIFVETIERELPDLAREGVRTRFIGRRDRATPDAARDDRAARGGDSLERAAPALDRVRLRRPRRDRRGRPPAGRGGRRPARHRRERDRVAPLRAGDARARPSHPHVRRAAHLELPPLAARLHRAGLRRHPLARLRRAPAPGGARRVREPPPALRRPLDEPAPRAGSPSQRRVCRSCSSRPTTAAGRCSRSPPSRRCSPCTSCTRWPARYGRSCWPATAGALAAVLGASARRARLDARRPLLTLPLAFVFAAFVGDAPVDDRRGRDDGPRRGLDRPRPRPT